MEATEFIWQNGEFVAWDDAKCHVLAHTLHYGAGAFEGIRAYKTEKGTGVFRLPEHIKRLFYSASAIGMKLDYSEKEIQDLCLELLRKNGLKQGYIRPVVYYGYGVMCVSPEKAPVDMVLSCWPWGAYLPHEMVDLKISSYSRIPESSTVGDAKLCGNYLNGILAVNEIRDTKYHEVLLLDSEGYVAEGSGENVFFVKDGKLMTPELGTILPGITRSTVIEIAGDEGFEVIECRIKPEEAFEAEEAFFTGTAAEVTPIRAIDDHVLGSGKVGPVTEKLKTLYLDTVYGRSDKYSKKYLSYV